MTARFKSVFHMWWRFFWRYTLIYLIFLYVSGLILSGACNSLLTLFVSLRCAGLLAVIVSSMIAFVWIASDKGGIWHIRLFYIKNGIEKTFSVKQAFFFWLFNVVWLFIILIVAEAFLFGFLVGLISSFAGASREMISTLSISAAYLSIIPASFHTIQLLMRRKLMTRCQNEEPEESPCC